jgi:hypothetical protein
MVIMHKGLIKLVFSTFALATGAVLPLTGAWAADLLYSNNLDSGVFGDVELVGDCYPGAFTLAGIPVRSGTNSAKVFNDGTKPCLEPNGQLKHRKEIKWGNNTTYSKLRSPYWYGFSMFVPDNFPTKAENSDSVIVAQWMGGSFGPELSFQIVGGEQLAIRRDWSTGPGDKGNEMTQAKFPIVRGVWTDVVVYRERSWDNDGVLKVWLNGKKVVDFVGPTAIDYVANGNGGNVQFKTGIYWGTTSRSVKYTLYFDNIRTSDVANGYDLVAPSVGSLLPPSEPNGLSLQIVSP